MENVDTATIERQTIELIKHASETNKVLLYGYIQGLEAKCENDTATVNKDRTA